MLICGLFSTVFSIELNSSLITRKDKKVYFFKKPRKLAQEGKTKSTQYTHRAGSCTSELQLKVNCRKKIWSGLANSWQASNSLSVYNSLVHDLALNEHE